MNEDIKKYCYNCGKDIEDVYKEGILCPECYHPVKTKDDKLGILTYAEDYIKGQAKSKAFSKTYNYARNFFLSKLASYFLVVAVTISSVSTVSNVITTSKNKQYIEEPENTVEANNINYIDIPAEIYEEKQYAQTETQAQTQTEQINDTSELVVQEEPQTIQEQNDVVQELIEENNDATDLPFSEDQWNNFMSSYMGYCTNKEYDPIIFENGVVTGPVSAAFAKDDGTDIGTVMVPNGDHIYAYYYYDDGNWSNNDGDVIFGRLELIDKGYTYAVISDESSSATFEEILGE